MKYAYTNSVYTLSQLSIPWVFHCILLKVIGGILLKVKKKTSRKLSKVRKQHLHTENYI